MSQASFPRTVPRRRAAAGVGAALLLTVFAASPLFALARFDTPQGKDRKIPAEQLPPRQTPQTSLKLVPGKPSVTPCPGDAASGRVRLVVSGHDPKRVPPYKWSVSGGSISGAGATRLWDLSNAKPGVYQARVTLDRSWFAAAVLNPLSASANVAVTPCQRRPEPTPTPTPPPTPTPSPTPKLTPTSSPTPPLPGNTNPAGGTLPPTPPQTPTPPATPTPSASPSSSPATTPPVLIDPPNSGNTIGALIARSWPLLLLALLGVGLMLLLTKFSAYRGPRSVGPPPAGEAVDRQEAGPFMIGGTKKVADELQCSVFAPHECAPGDGVLVQAFAHLAEHGPLLEALAKEADREAARRGADRLGAIERGQELFFHLNMPGLEVEEPLQSIVWNGDIERVQFGVQVPEAFGPRRVNCKLTVSVAGVPVGHVRFVFEVVAAPRTAAPATPPDPAGTYVRYRKGFVSYASEDLAEVLKRVQVMTQLGIDCFQDLLSLRPGERWERKLYLRIDESDVFFLFWSEAARNSEWVEREVRYALGRKGEDEARPPEIMPVILEGPPRVPPPSYLPEQHFNDPFALLIKAVGATRLGPKEV